MRVLVLCSGGKDSAYATWWSLMRGWDVAGMVTIRVTGSDSMMFQVPSTALAGLQAASAGIPWLPIPIYGEEDTEIEQLQQALEGVVKGSRKQRSTIWSADELDAMEWPESWTWPEELARLRPSQPIDALVVGALRSDYQKTRIERMCHRLGIKSFCPLWHHDGIKHMRDLVEHNHQVMMTSVTSDGLGEEWLGRVLNLDHINRLEQLAEKFRFHIDGEGGEFETAVLDAPWMSRTIQTQQTPHWTGRRGWLDIWAAELV
jgi:diphthine-ammonia ligase